MTFYLKEPSTGNFKRVSRKAAMEYMEKTWGEGSFEERVRVAGQFHSDEFDIICSWTDFQIKRFSKEEEK